MTLFLLFLDVPNKNLLLEILSEFSRPLSVIIINVFYCMINHYHFYYHVSFPATS